MRTNSPRLPPLDTSGYISCPIDTPLVDFDQQSPLPCIIVTPSSPTEYHIAFHHKSSSLKYSRFSAQQEQEQPRARRSLLSPFVDQQPTVSSFDTPARRFALNPRTRTAIVLAIPIFIIACHILSSALFRGVGFSSTLFRGSISHGGFSSAAAHMRRQREESPPLPVAVPQPQPPAQPVEPQLASVELALD